MSFPIRARLTAWYAVLLATIIVALSTFLVLQLKDDLEDTVNREVRDASAQIAQGYEKEGAEDFRDVSRTVLPHGAAAAQVLSPGGRVLVGYGDLLAERPIAPPSAFRAALSGQTSSATVRLGPSDQRYRALLMPVERRGGRLLGDHLRSRADLVDAAPDVHIKISGCPNGCGQHHIADIGFQGSIRKLGARVVPQYFVMVGGHAGENGARFGRLAAKIPARRGPEALERLVDLYQRESSPGESASAFFGRVEVPRVKQALADLEQLDAASATPDDFIDLGESKEFAPEVMDGECSA